MEELNSVNNKKKRLKIYYTLLISVLCIIGVSFAWFRLYLSQSEDNTLSSRTCFSTTLTEDTERITLTNAFPLTNEDGLKLTPFTFTIKNNCDSYVKAYITIDSEYRTSTSSSYLLDSYIKLNISSKGKNNKSPLLLGNQKLIDLDNNHSGYNILTTYLGANQEKSYDLRIWIDSAVTVEQGLNKSWEGKIVIVTEAIDKPGTPNGWNEASDGTLLAAIKSDNDLEFSLTIPGRELSLDNEMLLASADDDYGTSYYYRGAVKNNYVQFANKCWRIVRITGDGSIKMVLYNDNSKGVSLPCSSIYFSNDASFARNPNTAYITTFNEKTNDNAYVGFMYGAAGASDYVSTHTNSNKSSVLANLEIWYNNNLSSYDSIISDVIWCNDKSTFTSLNSGTLYGTGLGYGLNETGYGSYNRLNGGNASLYATPNLICQNDNNGGKLSKFTVNDTIYGNGNLDKKIGLLTVDEVLFSGYAKGLQNSSAFLVTGPVYWWTMSPCSFEKQSARVATINGDVVTCDVVDDPIALRPAIALSSSAPVTKGDGTSENPYVVK